MDVHEIKAKCWLKYARDILQDLGLQRLDINYHDFGSFIQMVTLLELKRNENEQKGAKEILVKVSQVGCRDRDIHRWSRPEDGGVFPCHFALPSRTGRHTKRSPSRRGSRITKCCHRNA